MPDDPLPDAVATQTIALIGVVGLALLARAGLELGAFYPVKVAGTYAAVMALVIRQLRRHHPFGRFGPANQVTTIRAGLGTLLASLIGEPGTPNVAVTAAVVGIVSTLLDGIDGWLARRTRMSSAFGKRFDMETDAALILVLAVLVWQYGKAGPWVVLSGLLRHVFVAAGWVWPWMRRPLTPTLRGRLICIVQIGALIVAILPPIEPPTSTIVVGLGLVALCYSFLVDTLWLWRARTASLAGHTPSRTQ
jgi:phosphatidylglycerophosphate synthase